MKKICTIALIALTMISTSCKKQWTCVCQEKNGGEYSAPFAEKLSKKDAKRVCESTAVGATSPYSSCGLK